MLTTQDEIYLVEYRPLLEDWGVQNFDEAKDLEEQAHIHVQRPPMSLFEVLRDIGLASAFSKGVGRE